MVAFGVEEGETRRTRSEQKRQREGSEWRLNGKLVEFNGGEPVKEVESRGCCRK